MATLPTYETDRRPTPKFGRVNQLRPVTNDPDIVEGAAINQLGDALVTTMIRLQIKEDKYMVEDATTKLKQASLNLAKGEDGYQHVKSGDVNEDFHEERMTRFDSAREEIAGGLSNDAQRQAFGARSELARVNYGEGLINHITAQKDVFQTQTYEAGVVTEMESAGENWDNPSEIYQSMDRIEDLTKTEAARKGITGEARDLLVKENKSNTHASVIQNMVDNRSYSDAREWYGEHKDEIMQETQTKIEKLLDAAGKQDRSQQLVDGMWDEYQDDPKAGREYIRKTAEPEDRDEALRRFNNRLGEDKQAKIDGWNAAGETARDIYASSIDAGVGAQGAYDAIPVSVLEDMKPSERIALQTKADQDARGTTVKTDIATYFKLKDMIENEEEVNLASYSHLISTADLKSLDTMQRKDPKLVRSEKQIIDEGLIALNIDPKELSDESSGDGKKARAFRGWVESQLSKDYDKTELDEVVKRGVVKVVTDEGWLWDTEEFAYTAGSEFHVPGVAATDVDDAAFELQEAGFEVTIRNIQYAHALRAIGREVSKRNMEALMGADIESEGLPGYGSGNFNQDFPQSGG